jgi:hypothetical protein
VLFGFLLPRLDSYRWLIEGGGYDPFVPSVELDEDCRCKSTPFGLVVDGELFAEQMNNLTNFWTNIHGFPRNETEEGVRWRKFRFSGDCFGGDAWEIVAPDSTMIFAFHVDGAYWDFFARAPDVLEAVIARWPQKQVIEATVTKGLYDTP